LITCEPTHLDLLSCATVVVVVTVVVATVVAGVVAVVVEVGLVVAVVADVLPVPVVFAARPVAGVVDRAAVGGTVGPDVDVALLVVTVVRVVA
jgi:hypothetical protein